MASMGIFEGLMATIDTGLGNFITKYSGDLSASLGPVFSTCLAMYFIFWGYGCWTGRRGLSGGEILGAILKVSIIGMLVLSSSIYSTHIVANVMNFGESLVVGMHTGGQQTQTATTMQSIDLLFTKVYATAQEVWDKADWFTGGLVGFVLLIMGLGLSAYIFFMIMISKMALAVLLAIGPIMILFQFFEGTKQIVGLWINQIIGTIFTLLFAVLGGGVVLKILATSVTVPDNGALAVGITQVAMVGVSTMFMSQVGGLASAVSGGVTAGASGLKDSFKAAGSAAAAPKSALDAGKALKEKGLSKFNAMKETTRTPGS